MKNATWFRLFLLELVGRFRAPRWWINVVVMNAIYNCKYLDTSVPPGIGMYLVRRLNGRVSFYSSQQKLLTCISSKDIPDGGSDA
jgi:hypothetical protein